MEDQVVHNIDASAFPRSEIRTIRGPLDMAVTGVMSFSRTDFQVALEQELKAMGATEREADTYVQGLRRGGVLVFATGSNERVDNASKIMNRHGAMGMEELSGEERNDDSIIGEDKPPISGSFFQTGRIRLSGGGSRMFVW